jgi:hypothetical protein
MLFSVPELRVILVIWALLRMLRAGKANNQLHSVPDYQDKSISHLKIQS